MLVLSFSSLMNNIFSHTYYYVFKYINIIFTSIFVLIMLIFTNETCRQISQLEMNSLSLIKGHSYVHLFSPIVLVSLLVIISTLLIYLSYCIYKDSVKIIQTLVDIIMNRFLNNIQSFLTQKSVCSIVAVLTSGYLYRCAQI